MNSNLPPIRKVGPAVAPKPKNIQIHAGRVIRTNERASDFLIPQPPSQPPPPPPPVPISPLPDTYVYRYTPTTSNNSNDEQSLPITLPSRYISNNITTTTSNTDINNNSRSTSSNNTKVTLTFDLPQPPSPTLLRNFNELNSYQTTTTTKPNSHSNSNYSNNYNNDLHADLHLTKNSTINVSSDSSNRPTITITARSPNAATTSTTTTTPTAASLKNVNYENEEPRSYNIPIQHIPSTKDYQSQSNNTTTTTNNKYNNNNNNDIVLNNNRNLDQLSNKPQSTANILLTKPKPLANSNNTNANTNGGGGGSSIDEVDFVQNLLMKNLIGSKDPNFEGICMKCGENILNSDIGLKAMQQLFHAKCFCCVSCGSLLKDKHFYAIENKPFCESCYMRLLEKCSVCAKPITDRILRATGKPFHPECFCCTQCEKNLDGIPFTVDATNKIHCIECFHNKYAPRCYMCHLPITPDIGQEETTRIVALDKSFHVSCYKCEDCGIMLSANMGDKVSGCYPLDDHIYCKNCNVQRIRGLKIPKQTSLPINTNLTPRSTDL